MKADYPPLILLNDITARMPKFWQMLDYAAPIARKAAGCSERVYAPSEAATAAGMRSLDFRPDILDQKIPDPFMAAALAQWRKDKQVFVLDPDLAQVLSEQDDTPVPPAVLDYLSYPCFYVELHGLEEFYPTLHGFLFSIGWSTIYHSEFLSFVFVGQGGCEISPFELPLGAESVSAAFDRSIRQKLLSKNEAAIRRAEFERSGRDSAVQLLQFASQVVMYLCACNAEITPDPEQKSITRRTPGVIKDRYAEVCKWDVGFRFGATVRAQQQAPATENSVSRQGSHTAKRPHMRRGHWHHFWTGPMDSAQDRKLVLKWLPPIFVGSSQDGEMPVTLHKVKL